jgi:hypothetical protein
VSTNLKTSRAPKWQSIYRRIIAHPLPKSTN